MRPIAVTGLGAVTPCGNDVATLWDNLCAGRSGIDHIRGFDARDHSVKIAGEVKGFEPTEHDISDREARRLDRFVQFGLAAAGQALGQSGLLDGNGKVGGGIASERCGVVVGTGMGGLASIEREALRYQQRGPRAVAATLVPAAVPDVAASTIALKCGAHGPSYAVTTACSSGTDALISAAHLLGSGSCDVVVAGGAEATVTPLAIATFANLKALSRDGGPPEAVCRPFDRRRNGFVMGEGAGILVLERLEFARRRGAEIIALLIGFGQSTDAHHPTAPNPDAAMVAGAMRMALDLAGIMPSAVDYINAHGTGTAQNDAMETRALKVVFGPGATEVPISSTKSMTGHLIGATGGVEAVVAVQSIRTGRIPPTINLVDPDPECDLDYVPLRARERRVEVAMSNTFGFGGHNSSVLLASPAWRSR